MGDQHQWYQNILTTPKGNPVFIGSYSTFHHPQPYAIIHLLCLCGFAYCRHFVHMESYNTFVFAVWLLELGVMFSRFIHVAACVRAPFLFIAE